MQQKRLIIALLISTAILFLWTYLVPNKPPEPAATPASQATPQQAVTPVSTPANTPSPAPATSPVAPVNTNPHRWISIKAPLYDVKFDSLGAEATSWIIKKNNDSGQEIYSVAGNKKNHVPLELISQKGLERQPREAPVQL